MCLLWLRDGVDQSVICLSTSRSLKLPLQNMLINSPATDSLLWRADDLFQPGSPEIIDFRNTPAPLLLEI